jgi:glycosyltransferase involved in cell wall biosynthesis
MHSGCHPRHPTLSLIVPLFNEDENLPVLIQSVLAVLSEDPDFLELVLIDDGSRDHTRAKALEFSACDPRIRLISHERNRGLGAAIRTGLREAKGDLILYTDADLPFDFRLIPQLVALSTGENVVIGYRTNRGDGLRRWLQSRVYNLLCRFLLGLHLHDVNFACKLLPRRTELNARLSAEGSFIDAELLFECRTEGLSLTEFPMAYFPRTRGESTLSRPRVVIVILKELFRHFFRPSYLEYLKKQQSGRPRLPRYSSLGYAVTIVLLLNLLLYALTGVNLFMTVLTAIAIVTGYGAVGTSLTGRFLATIAAAYFLLPPFYALNVSTRSDLWRLILFTLIVLSMAGMGASQKWIERHANKSQ